MADQKTFFNIGTGETTNVLDLNPIDPARFPINVTSFPFKYVLQSNEQITVPEGSFYYIKSEGLTLKGRSCLAFKGNSVCRLED